MRTVYFKQRRLLEAAGFSVTPFEFGGEKGCVLVQAGRRSEAPCFDRRQGELESVSAMVRDPDPTPGLHR